MRNEATLEEWRALYDIGIKLKELKPWEELYDMDLITIKLPEEEPIICSVMGKGGEFYGIAGYDGVSEIHNFFELTKNSSTDMPQHQLIRYQENIVCNFGDRENLTTKERNLIKELGLKFRGKNNWIYFRRFEKGYAPYMPNREEVLRFTFILNQVYEAVQELNNGMKIDFENGKTLLRELDKNNNEWSTVEDEVFIPNVHYPIPVLEDELLIQRIKRQKKDKSILEFDIAYLNYIVNERGYEKPLVTRMSLLADGRSGMILSQNIVTPEDDDVDAVFGTVINYIMQRGIPYQIVVRDNYIGTILVDLCEQVGIELVLSPILYGIDGFVEECYKFRF